jgi:hypothetical protein
MSQVRRPPLKAEVLGDGLATAERVLYESLTGVISVFPLSEADRFNRIDPRGCHMPSWPSYC